MKWNEALKILRKNKKMTQEEVSNLIGTSPGYYWQFEKGMTNPSRMIWEKLCSVLCTEKYPRELLLMKSGRFPSDWIKFFMENDLEAVKLIKYMRKAMKK